MRSIPSDVEIDCSGHLYVAEWGSARIEKLAFVVPPDDGCPCGDESQLVRWLEEAEQRELEP